MATTMDMKKTTADLLKRVSDPTPLYAVAGVGDLAVEKLREVPTHLAKIREELTSRDRTMQAKVSEAVMSIPAEALQLAAKISTFAEDGRKNAEAGYKDLATRGESIVRRISHQKATQDLINQAQNTVTRARVARGTASRGAESTRAASTHAAEATRTAAKSTATSARKTAAKATKAAADGAGKVGD